MVKSMTGYGRGEAVKRGRPITVELRSVNNRYLDCTVKLPRIYVFAEDAIKALVQKHISRGKVDVFVTIGPSAQGETLMAPVRYILNREDYARNSVHRTRLVRAALGNDAGLIGAALLPLFR